MKSVCALCLLSLCVVAIIVSSVVSQTARQPDQHLSTNRDGQMTGVMDALSIYGSVVSLVPSEATLAKCCESVSMTPHLDIVVILTRQVSSWMKQASVALVTLLSDPSDVPPCLPEVKDSPPGWGGGGGGGGGGHTGHGSPPYPPPSSDDRHPPGHGDSQGHHSNPRHHSHHHPPSSHGDGDGLPSTDSNPGQTTRETRRHQVRKRRQERQERRRQRRTHNGGADGENGGPPPGEETPNGRRRKRGGGWQRQDEAKGTALESVVRKANGVSSSVWLFTGGVVGFGVALLWSWVIRYDHEADRRQYMKEASHILARALSHNFRLSTGRRQANSLSDFSEIIISDRPRSLRGSSPSRTGSGRRRPRQRRRKRRSRSRRRHKSPLRSDSPAQLSITFSSSNSQSSSRVSSASSACIRNSNVKTKKRRRGEGSGYNLRPNPRRAHSGEIRFTVNNKGRGVNRAKPLRSLSSVWVRQETSAEQARGGGGRGGAGSRRERGQRRKEARKRRLKRASRHDVAGRLPGGSKEPWTVMMTCKTARGHRLGEVPLVAPSAGSSSWTSGEVLMDAVPPDVLEWADSDEYSEAHSVRELGSGSHSTCSSSLREEIAGPWVSTSLSFVVYDLDVIDDIPNEVMEVLCCDRRGCQVHPHDRYHYVGSKIIVQRLPGPANTTATKVTSDHATSTTFLPRVSISPRPRAASSNPRANETLNNLGRNIPLSDSALRSTEISDSQNDLDPDQQSVASHAAHTDVSRGGNSPQTRPGSLVEEPPLDEREVSPTAGTHLRSADESRNNRDLSLSRFLRHAVADRDDDLYRTVQHRISQLVDFKTDDPSSLSALLDMDIAHLARFASLRAAERSLEDVDRDSLLHLKDDETLHISDADLLPLADCSTRADDSRNNPRHPASPRARSPSPKKHVRIATSPEKGETSSDRSNVRHRNSFVQTSSQTDVTDSVSITMTANDECSTGTQEAEIQVLSQTECFVEAVEVGKPYPSPPRPKTIQSTANQANQAGASTTTATAFVKTETGQTESTHYVKTEIEQFVKTEIEQKEATPFIKPEIEQKEARPFIKPEIEQKEARPFIKPEIGQEDGVKPTGLEEAAHSSEQTPTAKKEDKILIDAAVSTDRVTVSDSSDQTEERKEEKVLVDTAINTDNKNLRETPAQTDPEKKIVSFDAAVLTNQVDLVDRAGQTLLDLESMSRVIRDEPMSDMSTQTILDTVETSVNTTRVEIRNTSIQTDPPPLFDMATNTDMVPRHASFSQTIPAVEVRQITQETQTEPEAERPSSFIPSPNIIQAYSPFRSPNRRIPLNSGQSPLRTQTQDSSPAGTAAMEMIKQTYEQCTRSPTSPPSPEMRERIIGQAAAARKAGASKAYAMDTMKGYCTNEGSPEKPSCMSAAMTGYPTNVHPGKVDQSPPHRKPPQTRERNDKIRERESKWKHYSRMLCGHSDAEKKTGKAAAPVKQTPNKTNTKEAVPNKNRTTRFQPDSTQKICMQYNKTKTGDARSDLFAELKEKVAKKESLQKAGSPTTEKSHPVQSEKAKELRSELKSPKGVSSAGEEGMSQRICIIPQICKDTQLPQRVCIIPQQQKGSKSTQKICILPQQKEGTNSVQKVCISFQQNEHQGNPSGIPATKTKPRERSSPHKVKRHPDTAANDKMKEYYGHRSSETNAKVFAHLEDVDKSKTQPPEKQSTVKELAKMFKVNAIETPEEVLVCSGATAHSLDFEQKRSPRIYTSPSDISPRQEWGSLDRVFKNQRKRALESQKSKSVTVPKAISDVYERCMAIQPKSKQVNKPRDSVKTRASYKLFEGHCVQNDCASSETHEGHGPPQSHASPSSKPNTEKPKDSAENDSQQQHGDGNGLITLLPFGFSFSSRNPPSSDQDNSNSVEKDKYDADKAKGPASPNNSPGKKKEPYKSLSKASLKEPSPPYEISVRAKNNVFSPVGWVAPRSGITSLFRGERRDEVSHGHIVRGDADQNRYGEMPELRRKESHAECTQRMDTTEQVSGSPHSNFLALRSANRASHNHCIGQPQPQDLFRSYCKSPFLSSSDSGVHSSVTIESDHSVQNNLTFGENNSKMHWNDPPIGADRANVESEKYVTTTSEHQPRIMSGLSPQSSHSKDLILQMSGISGDIFPSVPKPIQFVRKSSPKSNGTPSTLRPEEQRLHPQSAELPSSHHAVRGYQVHSAGKKSGMTGSDKNEPLRKSKIPQYKDADKRFQTCDGEMSVNKHDEKDKTKSNVNTGRHMHCLHSCDINEDLKRRLAETKRPSQIKKSRRERAQLSLSRGEFSTANRQSEESEGRKHTLIPHPKPRSQFPVVLKAEALAQLRHNCDKVDFDMESVSTDIDNDIKSNSRLSLRSSSRSSIPSSIPSTSSSAVLHDVSSELKSPGINTSRYAKHSSLGSRVTSSRLPVSQVSREKIRPYRSTPLSRELTSLPEEKNMGSATPSSLEAQEISLRGKPHLNIKTRPQRETFQRRTSKLPLPKSVASLGTRESEDASLLPKKPSVSPLISDRIKLLKQSISEKPIEVRETKTIKKLSDYLGVDTNVNSQNATTGETKAEDSIFAEVDGVENREPNNRLKPKAAERTKRLKPRKPVTVACHGELSFKPDSTESQPITDNPRKRTRDKRRTDPATCLHREGNTSQNHNEEHSSADSWRCPEAENTKCAPLMSISDISLSDFPTLVISDTESELSADESESCEASFLSLSHLVPTLVSAIPLDVIGEMKCHSKKCEAHTNQVKRHTLVYDGLDSENEANPSSCSLSFSGTLNDRVRNEPDFSLNSDSCRNHSISKYRRFFKQPGVQQSNNNSNVQCGSVKRSQSFPDLSSGSENVWFISGPSETTMKQTLKPFLFCVLQRMIDGDFEPDELMSDIFHDNNFLSSQLPHLDEESSADITSLIGPPQANSTFVEDPVETDRSLNSPDLSWSTHSFNAHRYGEAKDNPFSKLEQGRIHGSSVDDVVHSSGNFHPTLCVRTSSLSTSTDLTDVNGTCDVPLTGSRDVVCAMLRHLTKAYLSRARRKLRKDIHNHGDEETDLDLSGDLRIYGHSSFLELGLAWVLRHTMGRMSGRGDNCAEVFHSADDHIRNFANDTI